MFATAKKLEVPTKAPRKNAPPEITVKGLRLYASFCFVYKAIEGMITGLKVNVETQIREYMITEGMKQKKHPGNFRGVEGIASGSCQINKRSTSSVLKPEEVALCKKHKITIEPRKSNIQRCYVVNPKYTDDQDMLEAVADRLKDIEGLPNDFIMLQEPPEEWVVSETAFDEVFSLKKREDVEAMLSIVGVTAIKPTITESHQKEAFQIVAAMMNPIEKEG